MRKPSEVLRAAKTKIADPARWTKGGGAFTADGEQVRVTDYRAARWCALGATDACRTRNGAIDLYDCVVYLQRDDEVVAATRRVHPDWVGNGGLVSAFNDDPDTTHADVMALFDRAISRAEEEERTK